MRLPSDASGRAVENTEGAWSPAGEMAPGDAATQLPVNVDLAAGVEGPANGEGPSGDSPAAGRNAVSMPPAVGASGSPLELDGEDRGSAYGEGDRQVLTGLALVGARLKARSTGDTGGGRQQRTRAKQRRERNRPAESSGPSHAKKATARRGDFVRRGARRTSRLCCPAWARASGRGGGPSRAQGHCRRDLRDRALR